MAAAITILTGCGTDFPQTEPPGVPNADTSSTPASQARETGMSRPARPFEGDCAKLMSDAEASSILGLDATLTVYPPIPDLMFAPEVTVELHAGLRCSWGHQGGGNAGLYITLFPAEVASYDAPSACGPAGDSDVPHCPVEAVVNGTRVSGTLWMVTESSRPLSNAVDAFIELFTTRADNLVPAPVPIPAAGAWALPVDCVGIVAAGDFSQVAGLGASVVGDHVGGTDAYYPPAEAALWGSFGLPFCSVTGTVDVVFVAMGGGRWFESTVASTATPFAIEGYESAYVSPGQLDLTKVDIFDGPNWLHFQIRHTGNAKSLADALSAALDTTAAP
jgi:hypothetical protein